jgi:segregation and condensation protein A
MEGKQVPWWRKALNVALSGIRAGFELFSRTPKHIDEIEPETIAGPKEIREETELTDLSPELKSIEVEAEIQVQPTAVSSAANVTAHESSVRAESIIVTQSEETPAPQPVVEVEAQVEESAPEPIVEAEADAPFEAEVASASEEASPDTEPAIYAAVGDPASQLIAEGEPESVFQVEVEISQLEEELLPEHVLEPGPAPELDAIVSDNVVEAEPAEELEAAEEEYATPAEDWPANEVSAEPEAATVADPEQVAAELVASEPETPMQELPIEPAIEDGFEQVTEQQVTVKNVIVDELAPQPESAIGENLTPPSVSPVQDELIEPETQASEESNEVPVELTALGAVDLNEKDITEEVVAEAAKPNKGHTVEQNELIDQASEQVTSEVEQKIVDQVIEQPMELNQPNSEPAAEQEQIADTASPAQAPEEPASAPDALCESPAVVDEPTAAPGALAAAAHHPSKPFIKLEAKEGDANASPFSVMVSLVYDGPLDLLLDLIRKQDIDIYDIPIARITSQFLSYVNQLKASDVDVAGEFIYTASLLIHIKSKMLLPRAPSGPDDAAEDPRRELVERLLEHERFKNAAQMLQQKQMLEAATWTNPGVREFKEDAGAEPEIAADTVDLVRVFREILDRARNRPILNVEEDSVTVGQMIQFLSRRLSMEDHPIALRKLLSHSRSERALIAMFLALLELVRLQAILLRQDIAFSEIFIKKHSNFESVMNESVVHDDWK